MKDKPICGIYRIKCIPDNRSYIGASKNVYTRFVMHLCGIKNHSHGNPEINQASKKYKVSDFYFELVEECAPEELKEKEKIYIRKAYDDGEILYNGYKFPRSKEALENFNINNGCATSPEKRS